MSRRGQAYIGRRNWSNEPRATSSANHTIDQRADNGRSPIVKVNVDNW